MNCWMKPTESGNFDLAFFERENTCSFYQAHTEEQLMNFLFGRSMMGNEICIVIGQRSINWKECENDTLGFIVYEPKSAPA